MDKATDSGLLVRTSEGGTFGIQNRCSLTHAGVKKYQSGLDLPVKSHLREGNKE